MELGENVVKDIYYSGVLSMIIAYIIASVRPISAPGPVVASKGSNSFQVLSPVQYL